MSDDPRHYIEPLRYNETSDEARRKLVRAIESMPGALIVSADENRIHAVFTSSVFRFKDDAEFFFDPEGNTIHVRSASRIGWFDFGVNRRRVERIRKEITHG